ARTRGARRHHREPGERPFHIPPLPHLVPLRSVRRRLPGRWVRRPRTRPAPAGRAGERSASHFALAALPVVRPCRAHVLRLRLGDPAPGDGVPRHLPRASAAPRTIRAPYAPVSRRDRPAAVAPLPPDARGRPHQAPRRSLLARPHLHGLPLRDPARAEPAVLVLPPPAGVVPPSRGPPQPRRGADRALLRLRSAPRASRRGSADRRIPGAADPERQPVVPELADPRHRRGLLRRRAARPLPPGPRPYLDRGAH